MEMWKSLAGYEGFYEVSNLGRVRKLGRDKLVPGSPDFLGYCKLALYKDGICKSATVHRTVATAFIPNPENKTHVHHLNGDKKDNRACNLKWCSHQEHGLTRRLKAK